MYIIYNNQTFSFDVTSMLAQMSSGNQLPLPISISENSSLHNMDTDFSVFYITYHPNDEDINCAMTVVSPGQTFYMRQTKEENLIQSNNRLHQHDFYEFLFVLEGTVYQNIENKRHCYPEGSCCVLNKNVSHTEEYGDSDFRIAFLDIRESLLKVVLQDLSLDLFANLSSKPESRLLRFLRTNLEDNDSYHKNYIDFILKKGATDAARIVHQIFERITLETLEPTPDSSLAIKTDIVRFLQLLENQKYFHTDDIQIGTPAENSIFERITFLMQQTNGRIRRKDLEKKLHYTGDYLNKITRKYTGLSLFDYSMTFCMRKAADLLRTTDRSISDIAQESGFTNRNHFYNIFQKIYRTTPAEYRSSSRL